VAPYRTVEHEERAQAPRDPGIVGEVIAQFADRFAFLRELVQNAIDAGSESVEVRLEHDSAAETMKVAVRDQGEGMSRYLVENQLLVLFRSTKEKDDSKIGKFGIGFASVLAPGPRIVVVQTARDGQRLTLHLHPDLTYQLFDSGAAQRTGTTVELELKMGRTEAGDFARRSLSALERWCRHATVPIHFTAELSNEKLSLAERIDQPLALANALVQVRGAMDDGKLVAVVGILEKGRRPVAAFYNHGLMLYESSVPLLGRLSFKIQDPRLGHTLSRDDVRRDERFHQALAFARSLAEKTLPAKIAAELRSAAEVGPAATYRALVEGIEAAGIELRAEEWELPLVEPIDEPRDGKIGERRSIAASELGKRAWGSAAVSPLTRLLSRAGVPVLALDAGPSREWLSSRLRRSAGCEVVAVESELTLVEAIAAEPHELVLCDELRRVLAAVHRAPSSIALVRLSGAEASALAISGGVKNAVHALERAHREAGDDAAVRYTLDRATARRSPFALLRSPPLLLSAEHPLVAAARRGDPRMAASHLARAILLQYRQLSEERSSAILAWTLDRIGVA
jgi:Histidine kinase-, DNA gyrase B-, and HSP90-like ATPase